MRCLGSLIFAFLLAHILAPMPARAQDQTARIGVLAYRGPLEYAAAWAPLARYLSARIADVEFEIVPLTLADAAARIDRGDVDYLATNPGHFVTLERDREMAVLATRLRRTATAEMVDGFGSAFITRTDSGIELLQDVRGKRVLAVDAQAFGGFQLGWAQFADQGIDLFAETTLRFRGYPMDRIVFDVLEGKADVGLIRTGLLETLIAQELVAPYALHVLGGSVAADHPEASSTALMPEWPFLALANAPRGLSDRVAMALLELSEPGRAETAGLADRWGAPVSYRAARLLVARYEQATTPPGEGAKIPPWQWPAIMAGFVLLGVFLLALNRRSGKLESSALATESASEEALANDVDLTPREHVVLDLIGQGLSTKEMAHRLKISPKTVEFHRANLMRKFQARSAGHLISLANKGNP